MRKSRALFVSAVKGSYLPEPFDQQFAVKADNVSDLAGKLSDIAGEDVSILMIDSLDQSNHPGNAQITVNGMMYYADIVACNLYE